MYQKSKDQNITLWRGEYSSSIFDCNFESEKQKKVSENFLEKKSKKKFKTLSGGLVISYL